jgi:putative peptidoglycan lipid II flippase
MQAKGNESSLKSGSDSEKRTKKILIYALSMAFGTLSSRLLGLVRDMAFAALFSRTVTDAWTTAFRLPNMFRRLLGEGALSVSFIPVFVEARIQDNTSVRAQNLVNGLYTLLLLILATLTTLGVVFAENILRVLLDENYALVAGKFELTVRMAQIMFVFVFFISSYAFFMGILNALGKYALAAFAPTLWNVVMIISTFVPVQWLSSPGDALAWGVVIGGALQAGILVPSLVKTGYWPRLSLLAAVKNPDVKRVFVNMLPGMLGLGLLQITTIVNLRFASKLGEGPISYIYWADRLLELPLSLVSVSLGAALLPTLSGLWTEKQVQKMTDTANYYLRVNLFVAVPAAIGLFVLAQPIVELLFMRGRFTLQDATATAAVVKVYAVMLISTSCARVLVPSFYAIKNTWLPAVVSAICLLAHIIVAPILLEKYQLVGLVSSTVMSGTLNFLLLLVAYYFLIGQFGILKVFISLFKFAVAGSVMFLSLQIFDQLTGYLPLIFSVAVTILVGSLVYMVCAQILKCEEYQQTVATLLQKIKRRLG